MGTYFTNMNEETKFWIVTSIVSLVILILVLTPNTGNNAMANLNADDNGSIKYYSKILGVRSTESSWSGNSFEIDLSRLDIWQRGDMAYAANIK